MGQTSRTNDRDRLSTTQARRPTAGTTRGVSDRQETPHRKASEIVLASGPGELDVLIERSDARFEPLELVSQDALLLVQGLCFGPPVVERQLRVAEMLLEKQRALLEVVDDPVRVGSDE